MGRSELTGLPGIAGLLVAVPLTLCVVILGRHVPALEPLYILLSQSCRDSRGRVRGFEYSIHEAAQ